MSAKRLVVIGGGFTGVVATIHAIHAVAHDLEIIVIEPAAELGRGIAYGTREPGHRLNVPSQRMGVFTVDPDQTTRWLFARGILPDAAAVDAKGQYYVSRYAYGTFIGDLFAETLRATAGRVSLRHVVATATGIERTSSGWRVDLSSGTTVQADVVALCSGHVAPACPCPVDFETRTHPKFIADPWAEDALRPLDSSDAILVVGTGLTAVDVIASLLQRGHEGHLVAMSRRGLLPRPQGHFINDLDVLDGQPPPRTALGLLRLVRRCVGRYSAEFGWQPPVDSIRTKLPLLWSALPAREKRRVVARLLPFWDVHRFRIAPQTEAVVGAALADDRLSIDIAALTGVTRRADRFVVTSKRPGGLFEERIYDGLVLCTGPKKDPLAHPVASALVAHGAARLDDVGLGLAVDQHSRVLDRGGRPHHDLLAFGPLTRGSFGEMTGAPDISRHIERIAVTAFGHAFGSPRLD